MSGKDKGYSKTYKISSEFAVGSANSKTYLYPNFNSKDVIRLADQNSAFSLIEIIINNRLILSEYKEKRLTLSVYDAEQNMYPERYTLPALGGLSALSWGDGICLLAREEETKIRISVVNFYTNAVVWEKQFADSGDIHIPIIRHDYIVACTYGERQIFALDTLTGRELWRHDYTEFGRYADGLQRSFRGRILAFKFWQDSVIVCTSGCYLIRVDLATGRTHWLLQLADPYGIFVIDGDVIHLSQFRRYYLVNAHTGKVIAEHDITTLEWPQDKYGSILGISGHSVDEEFIYITAQSAQKVLVIDKQQWEMVQILDISEGKGSPQASAPLLAGNKLCQVDGQSDLHVFERVG